MGHHVFRDLPALLRPGDLLVANDTRVLPARLFARVPAGREVEVLLLRREPSAPEERIWSALARPARAFRATRFPASGLIRCFPKICRSSNIRPTTTIWTKRVLRHSLGDTSWRF